MFPFSTLSDDQETQTEQTDQKKARSRAVERTIERVGQDGIEVGGLAFLREPARLAGPQARPGLRLSRHPRPRG